jgi:hypothetical protein
MSESSLVHLSLQELVAYVYGTRARLTDLQSIRLSGDRSLDLQRLLEEASRAVDDADTVLLDLAQRTPAMGWLLFDLIKATHDGSIQRLSQRIKAILPPKG